MGCYTLLQTQSRKSCTRLYKRLSLAASFQRPPPKPRNGQLFTEGASHRCLSLARPHAQFNRFPQEKPVPVLRPRPKPGSQNRPQTTRREHVFTPAHPLNYESTCHVGGFFVCLFSFNAKASVLTLPPKKLHLKISPVKPTCNRTR